MAGRGGDGDSGDRVFRAVSFAMDQSLDVVWWQLFTSVGKERSLADVRKWVAEHNHIAATS